MVYQVYPRSFADGNGDGTGDIAGIRSRIPYLVELGVDAIWINPWYRSPLADGGYDVADYRQIEDRYGTIDGAADLIAEANAAGIKVIVDVVPNHTSREHVWFEAALKAGRGSPERNRYHFLPGKGPDGAEPPTDWQSVFGGPAWSRVPDGDWYLHLFDASQPDLNWENPEVRSEFLAVLEFWLERGVDGFRVDVAHGLVKDMTWPDMHEATDEILSGAKHENHPFWDRDGIHEIVREWRALIDRYADRMMVAEAWVPSLERLALYLRPDEYHQSFSFDFVGTDWDPSEFRRIITESTVKTQSVGSTTTWVLSNHDVVRHPTRYGLPNGTNWRAWLLDGPHDMLDAELGARRGRAANLMLLALPGSTYLYQGDELGLPEVYDLPLDVLDDPVWERSNHTRKGRDGCRVPLPWTTDGPSLGFGAGDPWLPQPAAWSELSVQAQEADPDSNLSLHRHALAVRKAELVQSESLTWIDTDPSVIAFDRGTISCWLNMGERPIDLPDGVDIIVASNPSQGATALEPNTAVWTRSSS